MRSFAFTLLLWSLSLNLYAEVDNRHIVSLSASATQSVENDTAIIRFAAKAQARDPADVIHIINQKMQQALEDLEDVRGITLQTGSYQVTPIYDKNRITIWRGSQTLILQTQNLEQLPELIAQVQNSLPYQSMQFTLSSEERLRIEKQLMPEAIDNFKAQAKLAMQSFGAQQALPLETQIQTQPPQNTPMLKAMAMHDAAPALKAGKSQVTVTVRGKFVFLYK